MRIFTLFNINRKNECLIFVHSGMVVNGRVEQSESSNYGFLWGVIPRA